MAMIIRYDQLIGAISTALDAVESDLLGAATNHSRRVVILTVEIGRRLGLDDEELRAAWIAALFHDSALTEFLADEHGEKSDGKFWTHCDYGERNAADLFFVGKIGDGTGAGGAVKYHHESPDGSGAFGKHCGEYPLTAEIIQLADQLDVRHHLSRITEANLPTIKQHIAAERGTRYGELSATSLLKIFDADLLNRLRDENVIAESLALLPAWEIALDESSAIRLAGVITRIIDDKSTFTRRHSTQISNRAYLMAQHYHYSEDDRAALYFAAALHDLGKLFTPTEVLEKPGKLTTEEFEIIKGHVKKTAEILRDISGLENIAYWAAAHHEKLNGAGYPRGLSANELDFNARLLGIIDVYQAVSEKRPYHDGRNHEDTMAILQTMADAGFIDREITRDCAEAFAPYSLRDLPSPTEMRREIGGENRQ